MMNDRKIALLEAENLQLRQENEQLTLQVKLLTEELLLMRQRLFGRSSEKTSLIVDDEQISIFNEPEQAKADDAVEAELEKVIVRRKKQKGKRELDLSSFPVKRVVCELPEDKRVCPDCGGSMCACGHDVVRRELTRIPARYEVTEYVETVYACRGCEKNNIRTPMIKSEVPVPVIPGSGVASPSLVAHIAHQKYTLALPLYRQEQEFSRNGIMLSRQTMANWLIYVSTNYLTYIYEALRLELLASHVLHADETTVQVLHEQGKTAASESYMWLYRTSGDTERHIILFDYKPNRKYENPRIFLEGFSGFLHSDGYQAYHNLPPGIVVTGCWEHIRRRFADILKSLPDYNRSGSAAMRGLEFCNKLFELERKFVELPADDNFKARYEARLEKSKPVMSEFFAWAGSLNALPKSNLGIAVNYALSERVWLENVLLDGRLEISNNRAERTIRPFTVGRKNWLFCHTENGAKASAVIYSIIETAIENGLKPCQYLEFVFETAPNMDLAGDPDSVEKLLPWNAPPDCRNIN